MEIRQRKKLEKQLANESYMVREQSVSINKEFDSTLDDGLNDEY